MVATTKLTEYLDEYLKHDRWSDLDGSRNGLQVEHKRGEVEKIGYAVDVTDYLIDQAIEKDVDMIIAHHGLYRGFEQPMRGVMFEKMHKLFEHDIAVYASHLPLDAHGEVGNNIGLMQWWKRLFGLEDMTIEPAWAYKGQTVWFWARWKHPVPVGSIHTPFCQQFWLNNALYNYWGHETITSALCISGHPGIDAINQAYQQWYDLLITGEMVHYESTYAKELGQSILLGWHYETETIWVKLLAHHLQKHFTLTTHFLDESF